MASSIEVNEKQEPSTDNAIDTQATPAQEAAAPPPDGGIEAWLTVASVFVVAFSTFGLSQSWGIFEQAYLTLPGKGPLYHQSASKLGYIGGCAAGFSFICGPFGNILISHFGIRFPICLGFFLMTLSLELASVVTQYWHLLLSQGILFGLGASLAYIPAISLPSQWFTTRKGIATGIGATGSAVGAIVFSPIIQALTHDISIPWALRIIGFINLVGGILTLLLLRTRTVTLKVTTYNPFDLSLFRNFNYVMYLIFFLLGAVGYITPIFILPEYCASLGISSGNSAGVISILSAANAVGRVLWGFAGDRLGFINTLCVTQLLTGLMCILVWLFATTLADVMGFAILFGFFAGGYWSLAVPTCLRIVGMKKLGSAVAIQFLMAVVPPIFLITIAQSIQERTVKDISSIIIDSRQSFRYVIVFSGLCGSIAGLLLVIVRLRLSKSLGEKL